MVRISNIDEIDLKILKILEENSRMPNAEIARRLGLSEAAIRKRIKKLEEKGIIKKYTVDIDYKKLGFVVSLTGLDVLPEKLMEVLEKIKEIYGIEKIWLTSGDHTIMLKILAKSAEELKEIHRKLEKIKGIKRICPAIILEEI